MHEAKDVVNATTQLIINAGVIGTIALVIVVGLGFLLYKFGGRLCGTADRFVTGTLTHMGKMVERMQEHEEILIKLNDGQERLADRLDRMRP